VSAAAAFGLAPEPLARLAELRQASSAIDDASALYHEVLAAIARAADVAGQMKESPR
jgi:hypothetical protein